MIPNPQPTSRLVLPMLAVTQFLMTVDSTVMNVSLPDLVEDLDTDVTSIQAVIATYTLVMAASMLTGGRLGHILGQRRAMRVGLLVYGIGSGITAVAPNVWVLLIGWSVIEGLGAALVMPTLTAIIARSFTGAQRSSAYGTIAAAAAAAIAAGPVLGGFVTSTFSWRWVFAAEVVLVMAILVGTRVIRRVPTERVVPKLDLTGSFLSALGMALIIFGVLRSTRWGLFTPRVDSGEFATPAFLGLSLSLWLVALGLLTLYGFVLWLNFRKSRGKSFLLDPRMLGNRRLRAGLLLQASQTLVSQGVFFTIPLFLSIVSGLSAFQTGLRMLPISVSLLLVAPLLPRIWPNASPRLIVRLGLLSMALATAFLTGFFSGEDPSPAAVILPFVLLGTGIGMLASQLGNVIVSSEPPENANEVGGLLHSVRSLGASLGTSLIGAVVIGTLASLLLTGISESPELSRQVKDAASVQIAEGVEFVSDATLEEVFLDSDLPSIQGDEILETNSDARLDALQRGMMVATLVGLLAQFLTRRVPAEPFKSSETSAR